MRQSHRIRLAEPRAILLLTVFGLSLVGCEAGTGGPGVGTVGGAALGAGVGRAAFGNNAGAMLIGGAVGGLAGNATIDRQAQQRQQQQVEASRDAAMQRQLDFERQRALQQADVERQIEEQRLFNEWQRSQGG
jgi:hypothetical protein